MRNICLALVIIIASLAGNTAFAGNADQFNTKVLFNGAKQVSDSSYWQYVGTAVFPNIGRGPVLMLGGIGYAQANDWNIRAMVGSFSKEQAGQLVLDIRVSLDIFDPIHFWADVEYYGTDRNWYSYVDANIRVGTFGLVGLESENMHFMGSKDNLSLGPRVVLPLSQGRLVLMGSYQFHNNGNQNQMWTRVALNF